MIRWPESSPSTSSITRACDAAGFLEAVNRRDVGMIQRRQRLRLALEPRHAFGISGECVGQDLDRDLATEVRVCRPIHLAHPALAKGGSDFVDAEAGAWGKCHVDVSIRAGASTGRCQLLPDTIVFADAPSRIGHAEATTRE